MRGKNVGRREFLKQGSMSTVIASSRLLTSEAVATQSGGRGPVDGFDLTGRQFDSLEFCLSSYDRVRPAMTFSSNEKESALLWQKQARTKLTELVGGFPRSRVALRAQVLEKREFKNYTREKIIFQSRDNLSVFGYLLLPKNRSNPVPAIVCLPGHGRGCDDLVGIAEDGKQREANSGYEKDFALQTVESGYAAFAIEQLGFGCRRDDAARKKGARSSSCQPAAGAALLFGQTMLAWRVWDVMRTIDYLSTRAEIDIRRIATMGISGGGTVSYFSAALDERIRLSVVSGYFNTFRASIASISHCIDNYVPGILNYFEMYDIAGLIAPRGLFVESGTRDPIFPVEGSKMAFKKSQQIYAIFGAPERIGQEIFDGQHEFNGKGAFEFLKKWL